MAKLPLVVLGAVLLAGGGAAVGYGLTRKPGGVSPEAQRAMSTAIDQFDGELKAAAASVKERAATLAGLRQVQAAVATDKATATDMLERGELQFMPQPGEVIELGQIKKEMDPEPLLIQPAGGMQSMHTKDAPGGHADLVGEQIVITHLASVNPLDASGVEMTGYVVVSRPLPLKPAFDKLAAAGVAGTLTLGSETRTIGTPAANAKPSDMPLRALPAAKLAVAVPPASGGKPMGVIGGGGGAAGLGLILVIVGLVAGKRTQPTSQPVLASNIGTANTQLSVGGTSPGVGASGTPSPVASASLASPHGLPPGATVGRWEIVKRLGSGGMADVYLARARGEAGFAKTVAVKVMHPHLARIPRAIDHFLDEARLAANIHHPNVVAIQDLGKIGDDYVIVMEYVEGVDLERLLASARAGQRPVPVDVALGIMCRVCDGLNAAHNAQTADGTPLQLVHRDVKAANVLVSKQGTVKVVDFGIAKATQQIHTTVAGETKGTPSMMAPEQRVGDLVDVRADVYSTAAVAFEVLTGHGVNLDLAALAHLGIDNWPHLPMPSSLRPELPAELDSIVIGAMAYERERRPADCAALEAAFETVMKKYGLAASDKDIARWVTAELAVLAPSTDGPPATAA